MHFFISYSHVDSDFAYTISNILNKYDIDCFLDEKDIDFGDTIEHKIEEAINISTHIIVIIYPASLKSTWVLYEVGIAKGKGITILPLIAHPSLDIPDYIRKLRYLKNIQEFECLIKNLKENQLQEIEEYFLWTQKIKKDNVNNIINLLSLHCFKITKPLILIFFDIDNFNGINKKFGSTVADNIIQLLLKFLENKFKGHFVKRFSSDEFVICLNKSSLNDSVKIANKVRKYIKNYNWLKIAPDLYVTGSFGVAELIEKENIKSWILRSIYGSKISKRKKNGNAVTIAPSTLPKYFSEDIFRHIS